MSPEKKLHKSAWQLQIQKLLEQLNGRLICQYLLNRKLSLVTQEAPK